MSSSKTVRRPSKRIRLDSSSPSPAPVSSTPNQEAKDEATEDVSVKPEPDGEESDHETETGDSEGEENGEHCPICLQSPLSDPTILPTCSHQFCFDCILLWCSQSRSCPLCNQRVGEYLIHRVRSKWDYQRRYLAPLPDEEGTRANVGVVQRFVPPERGRGTGRQREGGRRRGTVDWGRREDEVMDRLDRSIQRRKWVYQNGLFAKHVASNSHTKFKPYPTPSQFSGSPELIARTITFLRRELRVWINLDVEFLTQLILSLLKSIDIRSESAVKLISEFLDLDSPGSTTAEHFAHELYTYIRSPYKDLFVYDSIVQYDTPTPSSLTDPGPSRQRSTSPLRAQGPGPNRRRSRSPSPVPAPRSSPRPARIPSRSRSPPRRRRSPSPRLRTRSRRYDSPSPLRRRRRSPAPPQPRRRRRSSWSRSPPRRRERRHSYSYSRSPSPLPPRRHRSRSRDVSWSPSGRYYSRSRSRSRSKSNVGRKRSGTFDEREEGVVDLKGKGKHRASPLPAPMSLEEDLYADAPASPPRAEREREDTTKNDGVKDGGGGGRNRKAPKSTRTSLAGSVAAYLSQPQSSSSLSLRRRVAQLPVAAPSAPALLEGDGEDDVPALLARLSDPTPLKSSLNLNASQGDSAGPGERDVRVRGASPLPFIPVSVGENGAGSGGMRILGAAGKAVKRPLDRGRYRGEVEAGKEKEDVMRRTREKLALLKAERAAGAGTRNDSCGEDKRSALLRKLEAEKSRSDNMTSTSAVQREKLLRRLSLAKRGTSQWNGVEEQDVDAEMGKVDGTNVDEKREAQLRMKALVRVRLGRERAKTVTAES